VEKGRGLAPPEKNFWRRHLGYELTCWSPTVAASCTVLSDCHIHTQRDIQRERER